MKDLLYTILIALFLGLFLWQWDRADKFVALQTAEHDKVVFWRDAAGRSVAEASVLRTDFETFKAQHKDIVDSLKAEGVKHPKSVVLIGRQISQTLDIKRDPRGLIQMRDRWTTISQPDSAHLSYTIQDSLWVTTAVKYYGFLGVHKKYVTQVFNLNPNVQMTGTRSYEIAPQERRLGFGISAGYAVTQGGVSPYVGVGAIYRIF